VSTPNELKVGVATRDISPPHPELLKPTGMGRLVPTRGVLDGLRAEAMAVEAGGELAFFLTSDTRTMPLEWVVEVRETVAERTGCDPRRVLLTGTHNHCSNPMAADDSAEARAALEEANRKMVDGFIGACVGAAGNLVPAEIAATSVELTEPVGQNRRVRLDNGTCVNTWGSGPVIPPGHRCVGPAGPDSTQVVVFVARRVGEEQPFVVLNSYPSHPHLYALPYFSGEFPGAVKRRGERLMSGATFMQASHTGGNIDLHCIHPLPDHDGAQVRWFQESAALLATRFLDAVLPAIPTDGYARPDSMRHTYYSMEAEMLPGSGRLVILSVLALGEIALVSMPGEMFIELGQEILADSPFEHTVLGGYNGSVHGYVPPPLAFEQGSYEVMRGPAPSHEEEAAQKLRVRASADTGEQIVGRLLGMLREVHA
jgi:neutral ceramidase